MVILQVKNYIILSLQVKFLYTVSYTKFSRVRSIKS